MSVSYKKLWVPKSFYFQDDMNDTIEMRIHPNGPEHKPEFKIEFYLNKRRTDIPAGLQLWLFHAKTGDWTFDVLDKQPVTVYVNDGFRISYKGEDLISGTNDTVAVEEIKDHREK